MRTPFRIVNAIGVCLAFLGLSSLTILAQETQDEEARLIPLDPAERERFLKEAIEALEQAKEAAELDDRRLQIEDAADLKEKAKEKVQAAIERARELEKAGILSTAGALLPGRSESDEKGGQNKPPAKDPGVLGPAPEKAPKPVDAAQALDLHVQASGPFTVSADDKVSIFEEDVIVNHPDFQMACDRLEVFYGENRQEITRGIASGRLVTIEGKDGDGNPVHAVCQLAIFENDVLYLRQWPEVTSAQGRWIANDASTYFSFELKKDGRIQGHGGGFKLSAKSKKPTEEEEE